MTTTHRSDLLSALSDLDDGTGTLGIIVDQALTDDPEVTAEEIREIVQDATADAVALAEIVQDALDERRRDGEP